MVTTTSLGVTSLLLVALAFIYQHATNDSSSQSVATLHQLLLSTNQLSKKETVSPHRGSGRREFMENTNLIPVLV